MENLVANNIAIAEAAECGDLNKIIELTKDSSMYETGSLALQKSAKSGSVETFKYLKSLGWELDYVGSIYSISVACDYNHIDMVKHLIEVEKIELTSNNIEFACKKGSIELFQFLESVKKMDSRTAIRIAAKAKNLKLVQHLLKQVDEYTTEAALKLLSR